MKHLMMVFVFVALALGTTGCYHNQIVTSPDYNPSSEIPDHEETRLHLFDLVELGSPLNLDAICPQGAGVIEARTFVRIFIVTFGQARVYCGTSAAELSGTTSPEVAALSH